MLTPMGYACIDLQELVIPRWAFLTHNALLLFHVAMILLKSFNGGSNDIPEAKGHPSYNQWIHLS
jgi:hypothetical protein